MKRIITMVLVVTMLLSTTAYAKPDHKEDKKGGNYGQTQKKFKDTDSVKWAEEAIEDMVEKGFLSGFGNGLFLPSNNTTHMEAIVTALRITGYQEEANERKLEFDKKMKKKDWEKLVQNWAYGYMDLAVEKGIVTEDELKTFKANTPVKRIEIVKYIVRALELDGNALEENEEELDYEDAEEIPSDETGFVYLAKEIGIMGGYPDNTFQPNKPVTRAQLAVLMEKVDYLVENDLLPEAVEKEEEVEYDVEGSFAGTLKYKKVSYIAIADDEEELEIYKLAEKVKITVDGETALISDIDLEKEVKVLINDEKEITEIVVGDVEEKEEVIEETNEYNYEGAVVKVNEDAIMIKVDGIYMTFELAENYDVNCKDGHEVSLATVAVGDSVKIILNEDKQVEFIAVDKECEVDELVGTLVKVAVDSKNDGYITIKNEDGQNLIIKVFPDSEVYLNQVEVKITELLPGDQIIAHIDKVEKYEKIYATRPLN